MFHHATLIQILETCHTTSIFPAKSCSGECSKDYLEHYSKHTGQHCRRHSCRMASHCEGIRCLCCQRITCYSQPNDLEEVLEVRDVDDGVRLVDNCSLDSFDEPCQVSFHRRSAPEGDRCDASEQVRTRVQVFLNATCSRPLTCKSYRRCSGLTCRCCQRLTCVTVPHVADR